MAVSTIDTHKFVSRLEQAGMPLELAEVQAEVLGEAFTVNLESLVTKEFLESRLDARFAEQKSYIDTRFAKQKSCMDARFAEQTSYIDSRVAELRSHIDTADAKLSERMDSSFRIQN